MIIVYKSKGFHNAENVKNLRYIVYVCRLFPCNQCHPRKSTKKKKKTPRVSRCRFFFFVMFLKNVSNKLPPGGKSASIEVQIRAFRIDENVSSEGEKKRKRKEY